MKQLSWFLITSLFAAMLFACGEGGSGDNNNGPSQEQSELTQLAELFLVFSTRSDITPHDIQNSLFPATEAAAIAFRNTIKDNVFSSQFISDISPALEIYHQEYSVAPSGVNGVEGRVAATHHLLSCFMGAANSNDINHGELSLALMAGLSALEKELALEPIKSILSPEDRELIDLLLLSILTQVEMRKYPTAVITWFETIGVDRLFTDLINQSQWTGLYEESALKAALSNLENALTDPNVFSNSDALVANQFNMLAIRDLTFTKTGLEMYYLSQNIGLDSLISQMKSVGGIMKNLTEEQLLQSGVVENHLLARAVYEGIRPEAQLSYHPIKALADELIQLGGNVPDAPDFSLFADPYLAVFQMQYDLEVSRLIVLEKRNQAEGEVFKLTGQPLSMTERYLWQQIYETYNRKIYNQFSGVEGDEKKAILDLLTFFGVSH